MLHVLHAVDELETQTAVLAAITALSSTGATFRRREGDALPATAMGSISTPRLVLVSVIQLAPGASSPDGDRSSPRHLSSAPWSTGRQKGAKKRVRGKRKSRLPSEYRHASSCTHRRHRNRLVFRKKNRRLVYSKTVFFMQQQWQLSELRKPKSRQ